MTRELFDKASERYRKPTYRKCHSDHKPLKIGNGEILGASCGSPRDGYDIYIGLCYTMRMTHQPYPWETNNDPVIEFQFNITDGCAPGKPKEFRKMIDWVADQLHDGKKIHVGCIGGHGRTGTFLAALVSLHEDLTDDPIAWVRKHHCKKAVESESQMKFLKKHYGCKMHKPSKPHYESSGTITGRYNGKGSTHWTDHTRKASDRRRDLVASEVVSNPLDTRVQKISHMPKKSSIWG